MSDHHDFEHPSAWNFFAHGAERSRDEPISATSAVPATDVIEAFDLVGLAAALSKLGPVLWLERCTQRAASARATLGRLGDVLLLEHPALVALSRCQRIAAHAVVTSIGPREWLSCNDAANVALGKVFLLPDTDYLAWDEMIAGTRRGVAAHPPPAWPAYGPHTRPGGRWRARLLSFELQRRPWLHSLGARPAAPVSPLGMELARLIARMEGAEFVAPLHIV